MSPEPVSGSEPGAGLSAGRDAGTGHDAGFRRNTRRDAGNGRDAEPEGGAGPGSDGWRLPEPAVVAAGIALVLVVLSAQIYPVFQENRWLDGTINQWVITFAGCYGALVILQAVLERLERLPGDGRFPWFRRRSLRR